MGKATVSIAAFGANQVLSITSMCLTSSNTPTFVAVYKGNSISGPTTIVTSDGYTLNFGVPATNGTLTGITALQIITPGGADIRLATTYCQGAYPLSVATAKPSAGTNLGKQQPAGFTSQASHGPAARSFPALLVLGVAILAFLGVNVLGARTFRRRQHTSAG
jgi:hypothetical protein